MVTLYRSILYANGNFGKSCISSTIEIYGLFFITDVLEISPSIAGLVILISLIWDAVTDPILGFFGDKYQHLINTLSGYSFIGVPITSVAFLVLFHKTELEIVNSYIVLFTLLVFRFGYTVIDVPHNSLFVRFSENIKQSSITAGLRLLFSALGRLTITALATILLAKDTPESLVSSFSTLSVIAVSLFIVSFSICIVSVRKIPIHQASNVNTSNLKSVVQTFKHRPVTIVFLLTSINSFCIPLVGAGLVYLGTRYSSLEYSGIGILNALATAQIISLFAWIRHDKINNKYFKGNELAYIILLIAASTSLFYFDGFLVGYGVAVLFGIAFSGMSLTNWAMLPNALKNSGTNSDMNNLSVFGLYTLTNKIFNGIAHAYLGLSLSLIGYQSNKEEFSNLEPFIFVPIFLMAVIAFITVKQINKQI